MSLGRVPTKKENSMFFYQTPSEFPRVGLFWKDKYNKLIFCGPCCPPPGLVIDHYFPLFDNLLSESQKGQNSLPVKILNAVLENLCPISKDGPSYPWVAANHNVLKRWWLGVTDSISSWKSSHWEKVTTEGTRPPPIFRQCRMQSEWWWTFQNA